MSSSKERTKKYRERLRENEEKYELVTKKGRERKKKDYLKRATQPEVLRAKEREKKRRQRKKIADLIKKTSKTCSQVSPQTFGKALSRAKKHLPKCPERKV